ncbi:MAG: DegT/DnrJ/EryC1/StrS family aminotransferase, partial [Bacteroidota bacterium]
MITNHGSAIRYEHQILGLNSRLDSLQAAILNVKLKHLDAWHEARRQAASRYNRLFEGAPVGIPSEASTVRHIYHQYTLRVPNRDGVAKHLAARRIPHAIYYPIPLHQQAAFRTLGRVAGGVPHTETAAREVLSLPMHTELTEEQQQVIASEVRTALT